MSPNRNIANHRLVAIEASISDNLKEIREKNAFSLIDPDVREAMMTYLAAFAPNYTEPQSFADITQIARREVDDNFENGTRLRGKRLGAEMAARAIVATRSSKTAA